MVDAIYERKSRQKGKEVAAPIDEKLAQRINEVAARRAKERNGG